jgi:hypothetical protein
MRWMHLVALSALLRPSSAQNVSDAMGVFLLTSCSACTGSSNQFYTVSAVGAAARSRGKKCIRPS